MWWSLVLEGASLMHPQRGSTRDHNHCMERAGPGDALGVLAVEVQAARNLAAEGSPVTHQPRIEGRRPASGCSGRPRRGGSDRGSCRRSRPHHREHRGKPSTPLALHPCPRVESISSACRLSRWNYGGKIRGFLFGWTNRTNRFLLKRWQSP